MAVLLRHPQLPEEVSNVCRRYRRVVEVLDETQERSDLCERDSSFFGTWKTEAKERMRHIVVGLRIVIFARASAVCAARPVNGCVGAVRSSISFSAFGKPSS